MTNIRKFARFVAAATPPPEVQQTAALAVVDCFGCILAGANSDVARRVGGAFRPSATGIATVFGTGNDLPPGHAALINAVAGHAYDLDDWEEPGNTHPSIVLFPALLAAVTAPGATGRDLVNAYCVGFEVIARLGQAIGMDHYARGFHATATLGTIGAAAAVARLYGLTPEATAHAMAIATSQAVGYTAQFGSDTKQLQVGFAARAGVEAGLLAAAGCTGNAGIIDSARGFAGLLSPARPEDFAAPAAALGQPWALAEFGVAFKPWPCCSYIHRLMSAALELRPQLAHRLDDIAAIETTQTEMHNAILPFDRPTTQSEALFSVPACVAQALVKSGLDLADVAGAFWTVPQVRRLMDRTIVKAVPARDPALNFDPDQPDILRITLLGGEELSATCAYPPGTPQNPMSHEELAAKLHGATGRGRAFFDRLMRWPEAEDVNAFFREAVS